VRRGFLILGALLCAAAGAGQEGFPLFTADFPPEEFAARRSAVYDAITNPTNARSIGVLEHFGFRFERMVRLSETDEVRLYARTL